MKSFRRRPSGGEIDMDLTPLIDCVFLMILFFLLTTEITVQVEDVELPVALEGKEQEKGSGATTPLLINVKRQATAAEGGRAGEIVFSGEVLTHAELTKKLIFEARYDAETRARGWEPGPNGTQLSKLEVILRMDRGVRSRYMRMIFDACKEARIYKLKVSAVEPQVVTP